jgi:hypothetical protein
VTAWLDRSVKSDYTDLEYNTNEEIAMSEARARLAEAIRKGLCEAWNAVLIGNAPPVTQRYYEATKKLEVGSLVVEISTQFRDNHLDAVGFLEKITKEPVFSDEDESWDTDVDGPEPLETCYYIRTLDGRLFRWHNAKFIRAVE